MKQDRLAKLMSAAQKKTTNTSVVPSPSLFYQQTFFPIEIIETYPANLGSVDLSLIGKGQNSKHYAIKTIHDNNGFVPASEFFCYELARLVSIPTPDFDHLRLQNGDVAFGSVWEGGVHPLKGPAEVIAVLTRTVVIEDLTTFFSKVFAFDLFVNNDDRHFGNYIFRDSFNNTKIALAFDFSRAWKVNDPFGYHCKNPACNTMKAITHIRNSNNYDKQTAIDLLLKIQQIDKSSIQSILDSMHDSWLLSPEKNTIINWWGSDEFNIRINNLMGSL